MTANNVRRTRLLTKTSPRYSKSDIWKRTLELSKSRHDISRRHDSNLFNHNSNYDLSTLGNYIRLFLTFVHHYVRSGFIIQELCCYIGVFRPLSCVKLKTVGAEWSRALDYISSSQTFLWNYELLNNSFRPFSTADFIIILFSVILLQLVLALGDGADSNSFAFCEQQTYASTLFHVVLILKTSSFRKANEINFMFSKFVMLVLPRGYRMRHEFVDHARLPHDGTVRRVAYSNP